MIRITIQITDPETAEAYRGKSPEIIANDLLHGSLMTACEVVSIRRSGPATPLHQLAKDWEIKAVALNDEASKSPKHRERFFTMAGVFRACASRLRQAMMDQKPAENPWKPIGELGEIAYMEDGSYRWTLWAGYEDLRLFEIELESGKSEFHIARIDDEGALRNEDGDYVGWQWHDASRFMELTDLANTGKEQSKP